MTIERLLKMSQEQQSSELRYYSRCPLDIRMLIIGNKTPIFHKLRQENSDADKAILEYCAWILAITQHHSDEQLLLSGSMSGMSLEEIREISDKRIALFIQKIKNTRAIQRERILSIWADIRNAKLNHGMSYRKLVVFIKKKHRFEVSRSLLNSMWLEIEEEQSKENDK